MTYQNYEFTAFAEADLLSGGDTNLGCGDVFTMPATATTCITVHDNDPFLSGDNCTNEKANDYYGQQATIMGENGDELGNGGQIYAESYHWVHDQNGNWYVMIEIEQEGDGADYFTFFTGSGYGTPPAGTQLTVHSTCNVTSNWIDYKCLDAGDKIETGSISGTVFCDINCDGLNEGETTISKGENLIVNGDFEDNSLHDAGFTWGGLGSGWYDIGSQKVQVLEQDYGHGNATGDAIAELECGVVICQQVNVAEAGTYCLTFDVSRRGTVDQDNKFQLFVNGQLVETFVAAGQETVEIQLDLSAGSNRFDFKSLSQSYIGAGLDDIELRQVIETTTSEPTKQGVVIKLLDADGNAVLDADGNAITTLTDADGNYSFDDVPVGDYTIMGVAPDGTEFTIQDAGSDDTIDSDVNADGMSGVVTVTANGTVDVDLGVCEKQPGALSGTYFCDEDRDGVDDGAANGDKDVAGKTVTLLNADGTPALDIDGNPVAAILTDAEGNYRFDNLAAGDYKVMFEATDDKEFIAQDVGSDDTIDSDANPTNGMTDAVTVVANEETKDVDVGVQALLGSLSGRYFCDDDKDGLDNDGADNGIQGVAVALLDANGNPVLDANGAPRTATTDAQGNYAFAGLVAATYAVVFTDAVSGKELTTQNVDGNVSDEIDSDASDLGGGASQIEGIVVLAGQDTPDNDAGVFEPNDDPTATDDQGKGCADEDIVVNFSDNFADSDSTSVGITMIEGQAITAGGPAIVLDGVEVSLTVDDEFIFNGETEFASLDIGQEAVRDYTVTVEDSDGGSVTASIGVTFCGDANSVESLYASIPTSASYQITSGLNATPNTDGGFDIKIVDSGDARFDGQIFDAYCLSFLDPANAGVTFDDAPVLGADVFGAQSAAGLGVFNANQTSAFNGQDAEDNLDLVNYIIAQCYEDESQFNGWEVQFAIWELTDNFDSAIAFAANSVFGDLGDTQAILADAALNGENFVAGIDDKVGVIIEPNPETPENSQPFIIGIDFETFDCLC
ncbi:hypothetical protein ROLI_029430 [Roseobacter fucihabitans]|uniref:SD-repeat containing protein B domain-containing protein n=1 Tax=Roseobacter fucihabitans TaxID=1537242 RepID=A0ABZ2BV86_9RHOB|nr:SdrD B-like domain-containing protein [Roseobacter litoralis]MBC6965313.1 Serine-aspartate repeat-containing protein D precursor [Roseobacter litoralis]